MLGLWMDEREDLIGGPQKPLVSPKDEFWAPNFSGTPLHTWVIWQAMTDPGL